MRNRALPVGRLKEAWQPGLLLALFGVASLIVTQGLMVQTGRFTPALISGLAMAGWSTFALALVCLPLANRFRFGSLVLFIAVAMVLPAVILIVFRWRTGIALDVHDGMFQTEIVTGGLLAGHDPYGTDFTQTALVQWFHYTPDGAAIAHHYIYYPLVVLVSMPVYLIERLLGVTADLRPMLLSVGGAALVLILKLPWSWRVRYVLAVVLFLDPFFAWLEGRNDVLWLTPILVCVLLALHNRWTGASWALGVAAALKLFAFPFVLFMAAALWFRWRRGLLRGKAVPASLAGLWLPLILTATPFLVWNAGAFWRDTVGWLFENPPGFPIYGFGLGQALLITHVVPSTLAPFPFGLVQAALGLPLIALGLLKVSRAPSLANVLGAAVTVLAVVMLCGRFTNDNYIAGLLFLFGLAIAARRQKTLAEVAVSLQPAGRSVIRIQHPTVVPERRVRHQPEGRDHSATDPTGALDQVYAHRFPERVAGGKDAIWRPIARYLQRYVDPKGAVLDIGCDRGDFIRNIHAAEKWGTDLRDVSRFLPDGIRFQRANGLFLAGILPLNHFDAIFMSNYLEHLASSADVVEQLRVACQLLRPGGRVIVLQPNIRLVGGAYWDFIDHRVALTEKSLLEAAELAGLKTLRLVTRFLPYSTKSRLPQHPLLVRAYLRFPPAWLLFGKQTLYIGGKEELAFGGLPVAL